MSSRRRKNRRRWLMLCSIALPIGSLVVLLSVSLGPNVQDTDFSKPQSGQQIAGTKDSDAKGELSLKEVLIKTNPDIIHKYVVQGNELSGTIDVEYIDDATLADIYSQSDEKGVVALISGKAVLFTDIEPFTTN